MSPGWKTVVPVVQIPRFITPILHTKSGGVLDEELKNIGDRTKFTLLLPNDKTMHAFPLQAIGYWQADVIVGLEVLYRSKVNGKTEYWVAGQFSRPKEDPSWLPVTQNVAIASRFWKTRTVQSQPQLYRYHDGVESWVGGNMTKEQAIATAASFHEIYKQGISPYVVVFIGLFVVLLWPLWLTWRYARRFPGGIPKR